MNDNSAFSNLSLNESDYEFQINEAYKQKEIFVDHFALKLQEGIDSKSKCLNDQLYVASSNKSHFVNQNEGLNPTTIDYESYEISCESSVLCSEVETTNNLCCFEGELSKTIIPYEANDKGNAPNYISIGSSSSTTVDILQPGIVNKHDLNEAVSLLSEHPEEHNTKNTTPHTYGSNEVVHGFIFSQNHKKDIFEQSEALIKEINSLCKDMNQKTRKWYEMKICRAKNLSAYFFSNIEKFTLMKPCFEKLDRKLKYFFFENKGSESLLVFSKSKFDLFLTTDKKQIRRSLGIFNDSTLVLLVVDEFLNIRKHYKDFPELLILEHFRLNENSKRDVFIYLRSLNVFLDTCKTLGTISEFKDQIFLFIEKFNRDFNIFRNKKDEDIRDKSLNMFECEIPHRNLAYIFFYNLTSEYRYIAVQELKPKRRFIHDSLYNHIKLACLFLLYNHLSFGCYFDHNIYQKEKINDFVKFISKPFVCINCIMEQCIDIITEGN